MLIGDELGEGGAVEAVKVLQVLLDGLGALGVAAHAVHSQIIEVGNLLAVAALGMLLVGEIVEEFLQLVAVLLGELVKHAKARVLRFQRIGLHPATTGILIKVVTRICCQIHVGTVKAMPLVLCAHAHHGKHCSCQNKDFL